MHLCEIANIVYICILTMMNAVDKGNTKHGHTCKIVNIYN
jgi:hypothetical protein